MNGLQKLAKETKAKEKRTEAHDPTITQPYKTESIEEQTQNIEPLTEPLADKKTESKKKPKPQTLYINEIDYCTLQVLCKKKKLKINSIVNDLIKNYLKIQDPNNEYRAQAIAISKILKED